MIASRPWNKLMKILIGFVAHLLMASFSTIAKRTTMPRMSDPGPCLKFSHSRTASSRIHAACVPGGSPKFWISSNILFDPYLGSCKLLIPSQSSTPSVWSSALGGTSRKSFWKYSSFIPVSSFWIWSFFKSSSNFPTLWACPFNFSNSFFTCGVIATSQLQEELGVY